MVEEEATVVEEATVIEEVATASGEVTPAEGEVTPAGEAGGDPGCEGVEVVMVVWWSVMEGQASAL